MASTVVDGLVIPVSLAGQPVLDFCNTRAAWAAPVPKEYLKTHAHLTVWAAANGLIPRADVPRLRRATSRGDEIVARAVRFRSALYGVLVGEPDWPGVNAEVRAAVAHLRLAPGPTPADWVLDETGPELPLLAVAWAAARFLTTPAAATVSACPSADCGWLFANPSGRRRWCSMALCGNRAKARRHAERARDRDRRSG
jgi:predicted RNA-binding Zn ribbon-like protein